MRCSSFKKSLLSCGVLVLGQLATATAGAAITCFGVEVPPNHVFGNGDNTFNGGPGRDVVFMGGGSDKADTNAGNDLICMGGGRDHVLAGGGDDKVKLQGGNDQPTNKAHPGGGYGEAGEDLIDGNAGTDFMDGGKGNDKLNGNSGNDALLGFLGNDLIRGQGGADYLYDDLDDNSGDTLNGGSQPRNSGDACYGNPGDTKIHCEYH